MTYDRLSLMLLKVPASTHRHDVSRGARSPFPESSSIAPLLDSWPARSHSGMDGGVSTPPTAGHGPKDAPSSSTPRA